IHDWSSYLHSMVSVGVGTDEYDNNAREDDREYYRLSVNYDLERWVNIGAGYSFTDRDSNQDLFDYDKTIFSFNVTFSL
ncbi:MAG: outer membrane beta-barrel protein, partial [Pseudomonadales bacterium]|nr:outer membrane beta-barrel protein [Pseudomonadales bacterium]